jgi:hypothetical protein
VTYLIVGIDRRTHARWHQNVTADGVLSTERLARVRARGQGIDLVVAAAIGPGPVVLSDPVELRAPASKVA